MSDEPSALIPRAAEAHDPEPLPPSDAFELVVLVGAELAELRERLVRRHGAMTLAQFRMLELMAARDPHRLEPWELGEELGLASNHVSMVLDQLEAQGYVRRHAHPRDGRRRLIEITAAGRKQAARMGVLTAQLQDRVVSGALSARQRAQLGELLGRVRAELAVLAEAMRKRPGP